MIDRGAFLVILPRLGILSPGDIVGHLDRWLGRVLVLLRSSSPSCPSRRSGPQNRPNRLSPIVRSISRRSRIGRRCRSAIMRGSPGFWTEYGPGHRTTWPARAAATSSPRTSGSDRSTTEAFRFTWPARRFASSDKIPSSARPAGSTRHRSSRPKRGGFRISVSSRTSPRDFRSARTSPSASSSTATFSRS